MADADGAAAPLYESMYDTACFVLGGDDLAAGAAGDWERRRDAPCALRIAIGDDGEQQAPPEAHDTVRARQSNTRCAPRAQRCCAWL
jgi:hypothetical protein